MDFIQNARKPVGDDGKKILERMNQSHAPMLEWGYGHLKIQSNWSVLDVGCGGGANVARLLEACPNGFVTGIDYSEISVEKSAQHNAEAIKDGRCRIVQGNVSNLPFDDSTFDLVTAVETVYFWPGLPESFKQVNRVLKNSGTFFICNELLGEHAEDKEYETRIEGARIYTYQEIRSALTGAGFGQIEYYTGRDNHWNCFVCTKV